MIQQGAITGILSTLGVSINGFAFAQFIGTGRAGCPPSLTGMGNSLSTEYMNE